CHCLVSTLLPTLCVFLYCSAHHRDLHSFPTRRSSDLIPMSNTCPCDVVELTEEEGRKFFDEVTRAELGMSGEEFLRRCDAGDFRSEEHTSELQSRENLVCRLLLEKKKSK